MTTTPKKLTLVADPDRLRNPSDTVINNFQELFIALSTDARFEPFTFDSPQPDVASISMNRITGIFISDKIWNSPLALKPFFDNIASPNLVLVCSGTEKELTALPTECKKHPNLQVMAFPSTIAHLEFQVQNLFKAKALHFQISENVRLADETTKNVKLVLSISRELNGVRDVPKLLGLILEKAREVTHADAGSIYVVEHPTDNTDGSIVFKICQNESVVQNLSEFRIPLNNQSIVGNAVIHETRINIPDLYKLNNDPTKNPYGARHDSSWDRRIGYETHSMLTLPMFDISHTVIGVIQLINCKTGDGPLRSAEDFRDRIISFDQTAAEYAEIVAHQAGIALENALLTEERQRLFEGFVEASVNAIEQRDPTTSGHSHRVAKLTLGLAEVVNQTKTGKLADVFFNEKGLKEIEFASLLHDFGKISVREQVLLKAKKLYPWELEMLLERFELIRARYEIDYLNDLVNFLQAPNLYPPGINAEHFCRERDHKIQKTDDYLEFILKANEPTVLEQGGFERLKDIANITFKDSKNRKRPFLNKDELKALSVSRGSLTAEEFAEIQSHVTHTYDFLRKIPWGRELANVPHIAAKHHEKIDGTGYPTSAAGSDIPVQSRMMTIADIFDALTAADRPYKKAMPVDKALDIIEMEVKTNKCDADLFKLFIDSKCYKTVL